MSFYSEELSAVIKELDADAARGLTAGQAEQRLERYGANKLDEKPPRTIQQRFMAQLGDVMILLLLAAAAVSFAVAAYDASRGHAAEWLEPVVIIAIVLLNAALGVFQESKAEAALEALKNMSKPGARVRRDGTAQTVPAESLVPGDILLLEAGDIIPADARLVESASLKSNESALTGESAPVEKNARAAVAEGASLGDRLNMVYSGSPVSYGRGVAVVTATGMATEMGKIASLLESGEEKTTPLQEKLSQLGKYLAAAVLIICAVVFAAGLMAKLPLMLMFMTSVSLAVAAIPEGLPAIVTVVLAIGVRKMAARHAIVRRLLAVETLGSTSVICSDKTGTLTQNRMTLVRAYAGGKLSRPDETSEEMKKLVMYAALCCDAEVTGGSGGERSVGDPTETAIVAAALKMGLPKEELERAYPRLGEIPFDSDRKLMTTINGIDGRNIAIVKGAPDILLKLSSAGLAGAEAANEEMSGEALRVLAVAYKELGEVPENPEPDEIENGLTLLGLVGLIDPPRPEAAEAVRECGEAGILTVMITGDHVTTAAAIARGLGILDGGRRAVTGAELEAMSDAELDLNIRDFRVYARVSPSDKIRIVKAWQRQGQVVAMTGDGVNDAPALKAADIGCAMGIAGTDVARGAADMILTDDNFATIVAAVRHGRGIYDNIRKAVQFLLSCNLGEIMAVFGAMLLWRELPLQPIQLLWINLVTDSMPALALGVEPPERDIMKRGPRGKEESIFSGGVGSAVLWQGLMIGLLSLAAYYIGSRTAIAGASPELGGTMAFAVMAMSQLIHALSIRSSRSLFKTGFSGNPWMAGAFVASLSLALLVLLAPPARGIFGVTTMGARAWLIAAGLSAAPLAVSEAVKAFRG